MRTAHDVDSATHRAEVQRKELAYPLVGGITGGVFAYT